jgi:hypothetical protein
MAKLRHIALIVPDPDKPMRVMSRLRGRDKTKQMRP